MQASWWAKLKLLDSQYQGSSSNPLELFLNKVRPLLGGRTGNLTLTDRTSYCLQDEITFMLLSISSGQEILEVMR